MATLDLKFCHADRYLATDRGDDNEDYRGSVTRDAHDILHALAARLPEWVHPEPPTKTAFVDG
jgi:hypothetical protein